MGKMFDLSVQWKKEKQINEGTEAISSPTHIADLNIENDIVADSSTNPSVIKNELPVQETDDNSDSKTSHVQMLKSLSPKEIEIKEKKFKRFVRHYMSLLPVTGLKLTAKDEKTLRKTFKEESIKDCKVRIICAPRNIMQSAFLFLLSQLNGMTDIKLFSMNDLVNIQFDKEKNVYQNMSEIKTPLILIYTGMCEIRNSLANELLLTLVQQQLHAGRSIWIFHYGTSIDFSAKHTEIYNFLKDNPANFIQVQL